jgi:hypothetical protein
MHGASDAVRQTYGSTTCTIQPLTHEVGAGFGSQQSYVKFFN